MDIAAHKGRCTPMKKTIDHITVRAKRVLVRLDLNVPLDDTGRITDDRRIQAALPTVRKLLADGGRLILMSHLGRPDEEPENKHKYSLRPVAERLTELLGKSVPLLPDCVGPEVAARVGRMRDGDVVLLENLRFHEAETIKDKPSRRSLPRWPTCTLTTPSGRVTATTRACSPSPS